MVDYLCASMQEIIEVIAPQIKQFEAYFRKEFRSDVPLLDRILEYIEKRKGKQLRPAFVLLSAALNGSINESSFRAATFVEMIHNSSLIHDDIIDDANERRGAFSINALWKNRVATFAGDNLFTKSILLLLDHGDHSILKIYADSIDRIIKGELVQIEKSKKLNLNEDVYFDIIKGKTATLLAASCAAGAASASTDESAINAMYNFGEKTGIAFQIKDDLLDYADNDIGKPTRNDIKEKKVTLPLLFTINNCSAPMRRQLLHIVKHQNTDTESVEYLVAQVKQHGGIRYAEEKMKLYRNDALGILEQYPDSAIRVALKQLVHYVTDRSY
jgi:octaprenyl-diphosphate synthase